jgi:hypothetical protein
MQACCHALNRCIGGKRTAGPRTAILAQMLPPVERASRVATWTGSEQHHEETCQRSASLLLHSSQRPAKGTGWAVGALDALPCARIASAGHPTAVGCQAYCVADCGSCPDCRMAVAARCAWSASMVVCTAEREARCQGRHGATC